MSKENKRPKGLKREYTAASFLCIHDFFKCQQLLNLHFVPQLGSKILKDRKYVFSLYQP